MNTLLKLIKLLITVPLRAVASVLLLTSVLIFALATLIDSPRIFKLKAQIALKAIKNISVKTRNQIREEKYENNL